MNLQIERLGRASRRGVRISGCRLRGAVEIAREQDRKIARVCTAPSPHNDTTAFDAGLDANVVKVSVEVQELDRFLPHAA
jgi:hypothetical protein